MGKMCDLRKYIPQAGYVTWKNDVDAIFFYRCQFIQFGFWFQKKSKKL